MCLKVTLFTKSLVQMILEKGLNVPNIIVNHSARNIFPYLGEIYANCKVGYVTESLQGAHSSRIWKPIPKMIFVNMHLQHEYISSILIWYRNIYQLSSISFIIFLSSYVPSFFQHRFSSKNVTAILKTFLRITISSCWPRAKAHIVVKIALMMIVKKQSSL